MSQSSAEDEALRPSEHERRFDDFLKQHQLHFTQSACGLGWVDRRVSRSGMYRHSVSLDVANESLRELLPNVMGNRSLFRFMIPQGSIAPHLTTSDQMLRLPGVSLILPKNPSLALDIAALLMLAKSQAERIINRHELEPSTHMVTTLLAIWFGRSARQSMEQDLDFAAIRTEKLHDQITDWMASGVPAYLTLAKFVHPQQTQSLTLDEALEARGISSHQLAALYPIASSKLPF